MATAAGVAGALPHPRDYRVHQVLRVSEFVPEGDALVRINDYKGAISSYDRQLLTSIGDKDRALLLSNRGYAKYRLVDFFPAIEDFSAAIAVDPTLPVAFFNRGQVYYRLQQFRESVADFTRALEIKPDFRECSRFLQAALADSERQFAGF